ncbi:MAG: acyl-CoA thioesterase [Proteobacteria bacterium]|nr:MAG: acyl-CoA thioesterase [Pseudomonadota bacterium]
MRTKSEFNQAFPVQVTLPVQWGDMDAFNHVNNTMYFRYFETARLAYFDALELLKNMRQDQIGPILAETSCRFKRPLNYPDTIRVGAAVNEQHEYGFLMRYGIYSESQKTVCSEGSGRIVLLDYKTGKKIKPSQVMLDAIATIEKNE